MAPCNVNGSQLSSGSSSRFSPRISQPQEGNTRKPNPMKRRWTKLQEIALLRGLVDLNRKGEITTDAMETLRHIDNLVTFSTKQLKSKARHARDKFRRKQAMGGQIRNKLFRNQHDADLYELSAELWGGDTIRLPDDLPNPINAEEKRTAIDDILKYVSDYVNVNKFKKMLEAKNSDDVIAYANKMKTCSAKRIKLAKKILKNKHEDRAWAEEFDQNILELLTLYKEAQA